MPRETDEEGNVITRLLVGNAVETWLNEVKSNPVVRSTTVSGGMELELEDGALWFCPGWRLDEIRHVLPKKR